ncbi:SusD/RagB family nutrient-binding outer membrane lipoprotein [Pedobacter ginsengisoli]|nr:SusD/RagB family nutrient-binding outer membrane lipoprotein [Pedobacter ginsengisoli]
MKHKYIYWMCFIAIIASSSCKKIDDLQQNPAAIYEPNPQLILTGILLDMRESPWGGDQINNQFMVINESYYGNQAYTWGALSFSGFDQLRNIQQLEIEAQKKADEGKPYIALAQFFKAYFAITMTERFGDIPLLQAMKGRSDGIFQPEYDSQKDVYKQCLQWLEDANTALTPLVAANATVNGDFYYSGKLNKWQRLINAYRLRVLISLSKRADDTPELNIKQQFADITNNLTKYPLLTSNADNFQLVYNSTTRDNNYPLWPADGVVIKSDLRNNLGDTYVKIMTGTQDPRLFVVANPTDSAKATGDVNYAKKFTSFRGGKTGELQTTLKDQAVAGKLSTINFDYWMSSPSGIPFIMFGAYETEFSIAEAINRGWINGDAADHFKKGITSSMKFYGIGDDAISDYFKVPGNEYLGNTVAGLEQILKQKYAAFFQNSGRQAFYSNRRTGVPKFDIGPANGNNNQIPVRWAYPTTEYSTNESNLKASLKRQYNGSDTRNDIMWLIK